MQQRSLIVRRVIQEGGYSATVAHDPASANPRLLWPNISALALFLQDLSLGDAPAMRPDGIDYDLRAFEQWLSRAVGQGDVAAWLPVFCVGTNPTVFKPYGGFGSRLVGYAYIPTPKIQWLMASPEGAAVVDQSQLHYIIESELQIYNWFLRGEVFVVELRNANGQTVDVRRDLYGEEWAALVAGEMLGSVGISKAA